VRPTIDLGTLRQIDVGEQATRFAFGGAMTVMTGLIAHAFGPEIGGLFLAFPAILPASLTLVARHEGREQAADEASGAVLGAVALAVFGATASALAEHAPASVTLIVASATWLVVAAGLWTVLHR